MATTSLDWVGSDNSLRQRGGNWYGIWVVVFVTISAVAFLLHWFLGYWQFWSTLVLAVFIFVALVVANRQTREVNYSLTKKDIIINGKPYPLSNFRAFSVSNSDGTWMLSLIPTKKMALDFDIIIPAEQGERIVDVFGKLLPMEQPSRTLADRFASALKF